jgi:hypothetical protein
MIIRGQHSKGDGSVTPPPPFIPATISLNPIGVNVSGDNVLTSGVNKIVETGQTITATLSGSITPNSETEFDNSWVEVKNGALPNIPFIKNIVHAFSVNNEGVTDNTSYRARIEVGNDGNPAIVSSSSRSLLFYYPVLYGNIPQINVTPEELYNALTVKMALPNQSLSLTFPAHENGFHKVIAIPHGLASPQSWGNITSILKDGIWEQINSFPSAVRSIEKETKWIQDYTVYFTNLQNKMAQATYQIIF